MYNHRRQVLFCLGLVALLAVVCVGVWAEPTASRRPPLTAAGRNVHRRGAARQAQRTGERTAPVPQDLSRTSPATQVGQAG